MASVTVATAEASILVLAERSGPGAFVEELARGSRHRLLGRVDSVGAALDAACVYRADVVLADVSSFERLRELAAELPRAGDVRVVAVSGLPVETALLTLMVAGARGFLRRPVDGPMLDWAITAATAGHAFVDPRSTTWLLDLALHGHRSRPGDGLTLRQSQVVELARGGLTNREIARVLDVSLATVKSHLHQAMRRLGAGNRWAATTLAERLREDGP